MATSKCNRCEIHGASNAAPADSYVQISENYGFNVYVVPAGQALDVHDRPDGTASPLRVLWTYDFPATCSCGSKVQLHARTAPVPPPVAKRAPPPPPPEPEPVPVPMVKAKPARVTRGETLALL